MLPSNRTQRFLLLAFLAVLLVSCIRPPYGDGSDFTLQHVPTVCLLIGLLIIAKRWSISNASYAAILAFLALHALGARYLYSNVPYDRWASELLGSSISSWFGFERNHYDRLVHWCYGVLLFFPFRELHRRTSRASYGWASLLAFETVLVTSMLYEILEWLIAVGLSPAAAEAYNGQQGDMWDAQKDMALAAGGAVAAALLTHANAMRHRLASAITNQRANPLRTR
jgi:putative membrane protein